MGYLDPLMPVGRQIAESLREHRGGRARDEGPGAGWQGDGGAGHRPADDDGPPDPAGIARRYPRALGGSASRC